MEVLTGDPVAAAKVEFPAHVSPLFSEPNQLVFANPTAGSVSPQKLRIRCNGRSAVPDAADPALLAQGDKGLPPRNGVDDHFKAYNGELVSWKGKRKRTSSCASSARKSRRLERFEDFLQSLVNNMMEKQEQMHLKLIQMVQDREKERIAKEEAWKQQQLERIRRDEEVRAQDTSRSLAIIKFVQNLVGGDFQFPQPAPLVAQPVAAVPSTSHCNNQCVEKNGNLHKDCHVQVPQPAPLVAQPVAAEPSSSHRNHHRVEKNDNLHKDCDVQVPQPAPLVAQQSVATVPPTSNHDHQYAEQNDNLHKDTANVKCSATMTDRRWLQDEVKALIGLWASIEQKNRTAWNSGHGALWNEIALGMSSMGFDRTGRKCREKWENMNKYFRRAITTDKKRPANDKTCPYFNELELLYKNGLIKLKDVGSSPPTSLGNGGFSPTSNLGNGTFSPTSNMENGGFSPTGKLGNSDFTDTDNQEWK